MSEAFDVTTLLSHTRWVQTLAAKLTTDADSAEDLAQDTWVTALERQPGTDRPVRGWLATVLRNHVSKRQRRESERRAREHAVSKLEPTASTYELISRATTQKELVGKVLELEEPYRETILLRYFEDLPYDAIAARTQVAPATVNSRITRGLARLREKLDQQYGERQAWVIAFAPLTQVPKSTIALASGASTMMTIAQVSIFTIAATSVATSTLQLAPGASSAVAPLGLQPTVSAADVSAAGVSLGSHISEEVDLGLPAPAIESGRRLAGSADPAVGTETASSSGQTAADSWTIDLSQEYAPATSFALLDADSGAGDVTIVPSDRGAVFIEAHIVADIDRVDGRGLTPNFADHVLIVEQGNQLSVRDSHSKRKEHGWSVDLTIHIPQDLSIGVTANSGVGDVEVRYAKGSLNANSGAGDVLVKLAEQELKELQANSGAGDVDVQLGALMDGSLNGNSGAGDVTVGIGRIDGQPKVALNSGAGDVELQVPSSISGQFRLETIAGEVEIPTPLGIAIESTPSGGQKAAGLVGAGLATFTLRTSAGDVTVGFDPLKAQPMNGR